MAKQFEGDFEFYDSFVRRSEHGNKEFILLEMTFDKQTHKKLIDFQFEIVKVRIERLGTTKKSDEIVIEDTYELAKLPVRKLKDGSKIRVVLEQSYEKAKDQKYCLLRMDEVKLTMEISQEKLFTEEEKGDGEETGGEL